MTLTILDNLEQGTPEWHDARRGIVTASVVGKLIAEERADAVEFKCDDCGSIGGFACVNLRTGKPIKTIHDGRTKQASGADRVLVAADNETSRTLTLTLASERISGWTDETPMTSDMWRGVDSEPIARNLYSQHYGEVVEVGFMRLDTEWGTLGYSPDGLVGDDGLLEVKAPRTKGHVLAVINDEVPAYYMAQLQAGLLVSGREWADFLPYVGGLPLWRKRIHPDPAWFEAIKQAVAKFEEAADDITARYLARTANLPATERIDLQELGLVF